MSPRISSSSSSRHSSRSWTSTRSTSSSDDSLLSNMQGNPLSNKSGTKTTMRSHTLATSELNTDSWTDELKGKINLFDEPLGEFFRQFVPSQRAFVGQRPWSDPTEVFSAVPTTTKEVETYPHIVSVFALSPSGTLSHASVVPDIRTQ